MILIKKNLLIKSLIKINKKSNHKFNLFRLNTMEYMFSHFIKVKTSLIIILSPKYY